MEKMKAIVYTEYGGPDVLKLQEVDKPIPKENEVLIKVHAVSVNFGDLIARNFKNVSSKEFNMPWLLWLLSKLVFGLSKPNITILGNSFSGEIESIGNTVKLFTKGEAIFGYTAEKMGAYAEYICIPENGILASKPANMTFEEASVVPYGTITAISLLKKTNIQMGQKVLVVGASGSIGSAAIQLAQHHYGAEVTGVCGTTKIAYVKSLGADKVIDYQESDFTRNGETYDIIFDVLGRGTFSTYKSSLKQNGIYLLASFKTRKLLQMIWTSFIGQKKVLCAFSTSTSQDLLFIKQLVEDGKIKSIIDRSFPLEQTAQAHRYIESGSKKGDVVITA